MFYDYAVGIWHALFSKGCDTLMQRRADSGDAALMREVEERMPKSMGIRI